MIDGDEIITIASETGFRLCLCDDSAECDQYFSSTWCPNNKDSLYACSMDGYVRHSNTVTSTTKKYEILFRKFCGSGDNHIEPARRVSLHWDKMCMIPTRPGDVLFLLGVAKTLYYSAFPGSLSPMAASVHSCSPGYTYGTPVMEFLSHTSRITAVEVSPCGHAVATGDANGYVKMIILNRPTSLQYTINKRHTEQFNFAFENAQLNSTGIRCHTGPVFSLRWLQTMASGNDDASSELDSYTDSVKLSFSFASGSCDRSVRIWSAIWNRKGISISLIATLDTLSSTILSLTGTVLTQTDTNDGVPHPPASSPATATARKASSPPQRKQAAAQAAHLPTIHQTQLLLGCTDVGTVYIWRVHPDAMEAASDTLPTIDSGLHLISMIHSSDYPVVNASLVLVDKSRHGKPVMENAMHFLHKEQSDLDIDKSLLFVAASDTKGAVRVHSATLHDIIHGESSSPTSTALSANHSVMSPDMRSPAGSPSAALRSQRSTNLLVRQLTGSPTRSKGSGPPTVLFSLVGEALYDSPVLMCSFRTISERVGLNGESSPSIYTHVSSMEISVLNIFLANGVMKQIKTETLCQLPQHSPGHNILTSDGETNEDDDDTPRLDLPVASPPPLPYPSSSHPPPARAMDKQEDEDGMGKLRHHPVNSSEQDSSGNRKHDIEMTGRSSPPPQEYVEDMAVSHKRQPTNSVEKTAHSETHSERAVSVGASKGSQKELLSRRRSGRTVSIAESKNTFLSPALEVQRAKKDESSGEPLSLLSEPALNSSKAFLETLHKLQDIDLEDVSVSSVETSSTDRQFVADSVVNVRFPGGRYIDLPDITEEEIARRMPTKPQLRPQVDRRWKSMKTQQAPTAECISKVTPRDALVELNIAFDVESKRGGAVTEALDMGDLFSFAVNVDMNNVFGKLQASYDCSDPCSRLALSGLEDLPCRFNERYGLM